MPKNNCVKNRLIKDSSFESNKEKKLNVEKGDEDENQDKKMKKEKVKKRK